MYVNTVLALPDELNFVPELRSNAITDFGTHVDQDRLRGAELGNRALWQEKSVQSPVRGLPFKNLIQYEEFEQLSGQVA